MPPSTSPPSGDLPVGFGDDDLPDLDSLAHPGTPPPAPPTPSAPPVVENFTPIQPEQILPAEPRPTTAYRLTLQNGETTDAIEVLTVLRDITDGSLILQIGDTAHRFPPVQADADFKKRAAGILRALGVSSSGTAPSPAAPPPVSRPAAPPPPAAPAPTGTPMPGDLPRFRLEDLPPVQTQRGRKPPKIEIPTINVGAAIETFLQHKRATQGDFPGRAIHVRSAPGGGITIEVDGMFFESVSDVTDAQVRAYLQQTIEEWQSRQG